MSTITASTLVQAPAQRVFDVYSNIERAAERIPDIQSIELLTEGPVGVGTRWRETRVMFKKEATEEMWITSFEPPRRYTVEAESHGMKYETSFDFEPEGDATRVTWTFVGTPQTFGTKLMSPLFGLMMKGMMKKCMLRDLEALQKACEGGEAAT